PAPGDPGPAAHLAAAHRRAGRGDRHHLRRDHRGVTAVAGIATAGRRRSRVAPYLLALPALAYLAVFFVVPLWSLLRTSLSRNTGSVFLPTLESDWAFANYGDAFSDFRDQIVRSFVYAGAAT